jgi:hypothetical protein
VRVLECTATGVSILTCQCPILSIEHYVTSLLLDDELYYVVDLEFMRTGVDSVLQTELRRNHVFTFKRNHILKQMWKEKKGTWICIIVYVHDRKGSLEEEIRGAMFRFLFPVFFKHHFEYTSLSVSHSADVSFRRRSGLLNKKSKRRRKFYPLEHDKRTLLQKK